MSVGAVPAPAPAPAPAPGATPPAPNPNSAMFAAILMDPAFQKMPPEQKTALIKSKMAQVAQAAQNGQPGAVAPQDDANHAFAQALAPPSKGAEKFGLARLGKPDEPPDAPAEKPAVAAKPAPHALDQVLATPGADQQAALMQYVYGANP